MSVELDIAKAIKDLVQAVDEGRMDDAQVLRDAINTYLQLLHAGYRPDTAEKIVDLYLA